VVDRARGDPRLFNECGDRRSLITLLRHQAFGYVKHSFS
jgi:hypothetical protein